MTDNKTGGPAFPDPGRAQSAKQRELIGCTGMTVHDVFMAAAITGLLANDELFKRITETSGTPQAAREDQARTARLIADEMIKQRHTS